MKLTIIIPTHNEERTVVKVLEKVMDVDLGDWVREIIIVDDGSTDKTGELLEEFRQSFAKSKKLLTVLRHSENLGKGAGIKTALRKATGDFVIIQDADLEYSPIDIPRLLVKVKSGEAVFGNRGVKRYPERGIHFVWGAKILTWTVNLLYGRHLYDLYTGYKLIPLQTIRLLELKSNGFEFEAEITCKLIKKGLKIVEIPIRYQPRNREQGKHINYKDFFKGFFIILKLRF